MDENKEYRDDPVDETAQTVPESLEDLSTDDPVLPADAPQDVPALDGTPEEAPVFPDAEAPEDIAEDPFLSEDMPDETPEDEPPAPQPQEEPTDPFSHRQNGHYYVQPPQKKQPSLFLACLCTGLITLTVAVLLFAGWQTTFGKRTRALTVTQSHSEYRSGENISAVEIAQQVSPCVVGITNKGYSSNGYFNLNIPVNKGYGSGIIISENGYIITNNHVVDGAAQVIVTLTDGKEYTAEIVGTDAQTDLAVLKIDAEGLTSAVLGDSSALMVGEQVIAIGNPLGQQFSGSVTAGIVSALNRKVTVEEVTYKLIQTDAAINEGNSGGALVNTAGEVVGINSVKVAGSGVEGLGFAIPIDDAKPIIEDLMKYGYVRGRPVIGVEIIEITPNIAYYYDLPVNYGLYVANLTEDAAAEKAGVKKGDIIIACNGEKIENLDQLNTIKNEHVAGDTITLTVNRNGEEKDITVTLTESKPPKKEEKKEEEPQEGTIPNENMPGSNGNNSRSQDMDDVFNYFFGN